MRDSLKKLFILTLVLEMTFQVSKANGNILKSDAHSISHDKDHSLLKTKKYYWKRISTINTNDWRGLFFVNEKVGWSWGKGRLFKTLDGGETWINEYPDYLEVTDPDIPDFVDKRLNIFGLIFLNEDHGFFVCHQVSAFEEERSFCYETLDGGTSWHAAIVSDETGNPFSEIFFADSVNGWVLFGREYADDLLFTENAGHFWEHIASFNSVVNQMYDFQFVDKYHGWALNDVWDSNWDGWATEIWKSNDSGKKWFKLYKESYLNALKDVKFIDTTQGWLLEGSELKITYDGGLSWLTKSSFSSNIKGILPISKTIIRAFGIDGIFVSYDGGALWSCETPDKTGFLFFTNSEHGWAISSPSLLKYVSTEHLAIPSLLDPATDKTGVGNNAWFSWSSVENATSYDLQIDSDWAFSSPLVAVSGIMDTRYFVSGMRYSHTYHWRVRARNNSDISDWSDSRTFTTLAPPAVRINYPDHYVLYYIEEGDQQLIDRDYTINSMPTDLQGLLWIKTANDDKYNSSSSFLSYTLDKSATVYVGYDWRAATVPEWLSNNFTKTSYLIAEKESDGDIEKYEIWEKYSPPGSHTLGGNMASGASGAKMNYVVLFDFNAQTTSFCDDFEDGAADGWTPLNSSRWQVSQDHGDNAYFLKTSNYEPSPADRLGEYTIFSNFSASDFTFSCDVRSAENMSSNPNADYAIVFGYQDDQNYSFIQVKRNSVKVKNIINDIASDWLISASISFTNDEFTHYQPVTVQKIGQTVTIHIDEKEIVVSSNDFKEGKVGVGSWNDSAWFDDICADVNTAPLEPIAKFGAQPLEGPAPLSVSFTDSSIGNITSWSWNFGDGKTSTLQNPTHTYQTAGIYTVSLTVTGPGGSDTETKGDYVQVSQLFKISGYANYFSDNKKVQNVRMYSSPAVDTVFTDDKGFYEFVNLKKGFNYIVAPSKEKGMDQDDVTITSQDAYETAQIAIGNISPTQHQFIAADVDSDGRVLMYDASLIARYSAGIEAPSEALIGEWWFDPDRREYLNLNTSYENQNYTAVVIGDVNGSWQPTGNTVLAKTESKAMSLDSNFVFLQLPVNTHSSFTSMDLTLRFDSREFLYKGLEKEDDRVQVFENIQDGIIRVAAFADHSPIKMDSYLPITFIFQKTQKVSSEVKICVDRFLINDEAQPSIDYIINGSESVRPKGFKVFQNYPNPFNPSTMIRYNLPWGSAQQTTINIYDIRGKLIRNLMNTQQASGEYQVEWDGLNNKMEETPSGLYFFRIKSGALVETIRLVKLH